MTIVAPSILPADLDLAARPYLPRGAAAELFACQEDEVVISAPSGTGKSRGALEKVCAVAGKCAAMRGLLGREPPDWMDGTSRFVKRQTM